MKDHNTVILAEAKSVVEDYKNVVLSSKLEEIKEVAVKVLVPEVPANEGRSSQSGLRSPSQDTSDSQNQSSSPRPDAHLGPSASAFTHFN